MVLFFVLSADDVEVGVIEIGFILCHILRIGLWRGV